MDREESLPLARAVALAGPLDALRALADLPGAFLLHSGLRTADPRPAAAGAGARWSLFGAEPFALFRGGDAAAASEAWRRLATPGPPRAAGGHEPPFRGGGVGYWAYDFGRRLERLPALAADDLGLPDF